jgi:hypothetical protein
MIHNLSDSLGAFIRGINMEILNEGLTNETFTEDCLKPESNELFECYSYVKELFEQIF